ncbi:hypothetical protein GCM10010228_80430 [Streptomyces massasporeus]|nr:hypothetical protein GCM10010228_80430 [Streptomyces massasporeus]
MADGEVHRGERAVVDAQGEAARWKGSVHGGAAGAGADVGEEDQGGQAGSQRDAELSSGVEEAGSRSCVPAGDLAEGQVGERSADHAENEASKVCVNPEAPGTRTIAPRARPSQSVGIYQPRDELMSL